MPTNFRPRVWSHKEKNRDYRFNFAYLCHMCRDAEPCKFWTVPTPAPAPENYPAPAPAPNEMSQQLRLRLRLRAKCNGQNGQNVITWHFAPSEMSQQLRLRLRLRAKCTGSGDPGSRDAKSCKFGTAPAPAPLKKNLSRLCLRLWA